MKNPFSGPISTVSRIRTDSDLDPEYEQLILSEDAIPSALSSTPQSLPSNVIPRRRMLGWLLISLAEPIYNFQAFPYMPQFIEEIGVTGGDPTRVGYFIGLIDTVSCISDGLFVLQWARLSDRIGRKPVLLIGLTGVALSAICLGLSTTIYTIVLSRVIAGFLNANYTVLRSSMGDILPQDGFARAIAWLPAVWCIAAISGPLIGGTLSHPYENFPTTFGRFEIWKAHPFLLPNLVVVGILFILFILTLRFFEETLPTLKTYDSALEAYQLLENRHESLKQNNSTPPIRSLLTTRLTLLLATNMINTFLDASVGTILPVIFATPVEHGGFGMLPSQIGLALALLGIFSGLLLLLFFARLHARMGSRGVLRMGLLGYIGIFAVCAGAGSLNHAEGVSALLWFALFVLSIFFTMSLVVPNCFTLLLAEGSRPDSLGAINGLSQTAGAISRAVGPTAAGVLLSLSLEKRYLGGNLVYYVLSGVALLGFFVSGFISARFEPGLIRVEED